MINILTPIIPIYTTNSPGIFYYYCSSPILHIAPLSFFQPRLIRTPCAVPHLRLVLGVGATHLLLYDIGSLKSYLGLYIRTSQRLLHTLLGKHVAFTSSEHPYLAVRFRGNLTRRYRRCGLLSRQQTKIV